MTERAAHLVDHVLPDVPVRQWVLTLPHRLRYLLAWRHYLCKAVVRVLLREVHRHLRTRARERGLSDVRGGAVAVVQRFGGALNLNVHIHALVLDGVFARGDDGRLRFHAAPELDAADVADVLAAIAPGVHRLLRRHGADPEDASASDAFAEASPLLAGLAAASVQGGGALGGPLGARPRRLGPSSVDRGVPALGECHARWEGFDLRAAVRVPAGQRDRLERVCRYALRPPVVGARLQLTPDGQVVLQLRHSWADLMRRAFEVDVLACPRCGGRLRLIALIEASAVARRILTHLGLPADVPRPTPARAPPTGDDDA